MKLKFEVLFSNLCGLLREDTDKSRPTVVKFFQGHIRTSFSSLRDPLRYRVPLFMVPQGSHQDPGFQVICRSRQGRTRVRGPGFPLFVGSRVSIFRFFVGSLAQLFQYAHLSKDENDFYLCLQKDSNYFITPTNESKAKVKEKKEKANRIRLRRSLN